MPNDNLTWDDIFVMGSVVDTKISVWSARMKLKAEDLGLEGDDDVRQALSLGCHRLVQHERLKPITEIAQAVEATVDANSLRFPMIQGSKFVPSESMRSLTRKLEEYKSEFDRRVGEFLADYEIAKAEMLPVIQAALLKAAKDPESAERAYSRVVSEYPTREEVRGKFGISWSVYALTAPKTNAAANVAGEVANGVSQVVGSFITQLRSDVAERLQEVQQLAVQGQGKLNKKTIDHTLEVLDRADSLNIMQDYQLTSQIRAVRSLLVNLDRSNVERGFTEQITQASQALQQDIAAAQKTAEDRLTGLGQRKIAL